MSARDLFASAFGDELREAIDKGRDPHEFRAAGKRPSKKNPNPTGEDSTWWMENGPGMVQAWIDWRTRAGWDVWTTPDGNPAIEVPVDTTVAGHPLKGYVDRIMVVPGDGALAILDLKTGGRSPESDLQLGVYRYALARIWPHVDIRWGAYWMARKGDAEIVDLSRFHPKMLEAWYARFIMAVRGGIFIPHLSAMCRACSHRDYCAAFGGTKSHLDPDSPQYKGEGNGE